LKNYCSTDACTLHPDRAEWGKTTAAYSPLPEIFTAVEFVNADEIAKGLSPINPERVAYKAGWIGLSRLNQLINDKRISLLKQRYRVWLI
jgi:predicted ABC-type ATPase